MVVVANLHTQTFTFATNRSNGDNIQQEKFPACLVPMDTHSHTWHWEREVFQGQFYFTKTNTKNDTFKYLTLWK